MANRILLYIITLFLTGSISISCSENIPDCPSRMCIVSGGWQLTKAVVDDELYTGDVSQYRLVLDMPSPTASVVSTFNRIQPSGSPDDGAWSLENDDSILRLIPNDDQLLKEDWIIETMTPRKMVLILNRDVSIKEGPAKIELHLEPF